MSTDHETASTRNMIARRQRLLGPAYRLFYEQPVQFVGSEGVWLYDPAGNAYLDAYNNVASLGHCHPHVVQAIARQAAVLNTHTRYLHETVLNYAEKLLATFPAEIGQIMFTCSGSEANDLALRVARTCTGGTGFIVTEAAYHGVTSALAELSPSLGLPAAKDSHARLVPAPRPAGDDTGEVFARHVRGALEDMRKNGIRPAGLLVDTIFSSDGVFADPPGSCARRSTQYAPPAASSSPMRCSPALAAPASRCGVLLATTSFPIWSRWASRWGMAIRSPAWRRALTSWPNSARGPVTSTRLAATPYPLQPGSQCSRSSSPRV
jgi:aminotransferase class III